MATAAEKVRKIMAALAPWQGEQAQFWSYTAALATLEIRLFRSRRPDSIQLVCSPCVSITGPVYWERCELTVVADDSDDGLFLVQDRRAGVRILCRQVHVFESAVQLTSPCA